MEIKSFLRVFDYKDLSEKPLILRGVDVGTYKNDVFCKWFMTSEEAPRIADFETYFCAKLGDELGCIVHTSDDVKVAEQKLHEIKGYGIAGWLEEFLIAETDFDLLEKELKDKC